MTNICESCGYQGSAHVGVISFSGIGISVCNNCEVYLVGLGWKKLTQEIEVEVATSPTGIYSCWQSTPLFNGRTIGVNTRRAILKFQ